MSLIQVGTRQYTHEPTGWRVVFTNEKAELLTFPVTFWCFREASGGVQIKPYACTSDADINAGIEDASAYEPYLGVIGPDEDVERFRAAAVEVAQAIYGTSALTALAATAEDGDDGA